MGTPNLSFQGGSLEDGVEILWNGTTYHWTSADILSIPGNRKIKEGVLNEWAQEAMTRRYLIAEYEPDHRYRQDDPGLLYDYEYFDKDEICVIQCYIKCHIYDLGPPVNVTIRCSREPLIGDWWLSDG